jgi:hypothetical protein
MAISDIPEYIEAAPGDLIRAEHWNGIQRQVRNGLRTHRHTRAAGAVVNDAAATDEAPQISTAEIADGAITAAKLGAGAITTTALPDGAVTTAKLADAAVTSAKMANSSITTALVQNGAVTAAKLSFQTVKSGSATLAAGGTVEQVVQTAAPSTKTTIYFPTLAIVGSTGSGISNVESSIVYRQAVGADTIDVFIRLVNRGAATASIIWQVLTFTS